MARRILLLNLLLLSLVAVSAYELVQSWQGYEQEQNLAQILEQAKAQMGRTQISAGAEVAQDPPIHDFFVIGERDLFSPDRRPAPVDADQAAAPEAPKFPKDPEMRGVSETGGVKQALLTIFDTPRSKGDSNSYAIGDFVQGWAVSDITNTTVTLKWNDQTKVISIFDTDRSGQSAAARTSRKVASVNIVRIGSQYAAVETTSPEDSGSDQGSQSGSQSPGASRQVTPRVRPGTNQRRGLGNRLSSPGASRTSRPASPLGRTGMVGFPTPAPQQTPNPQ
jgi:hypothetical protein